MVREDEQEELRNLEDDACLLKIRGKFFFRSFFVRFFDGLRQEEEGRSKEEEEAGRN
jgi:hypothetical protein